jgi:hypothetical protein
MSRIVTDNHTGQVYSPLGRCQIREHSTPSAGAALHSRDYVHESPRLLESIPNKTGVAVSLLVTRSLFLPTSHGILTRNMLKTSTRQLLKDI